MSDWSAQKQLLETRLQELDNNLHKIDDILDEPHSKDFEDFAKESEDDEECNDTSRLDHHAA